MRAPLTRPRYYKVQTHPNALVPYEDLEPGKYVSRISWLDNHLKDPELVPATTYYYLQIKEGNLILLEIIQ
jgi:hypothetical protein